MNNFVILNQILYLNMFRDIFNSEFNYSFEPRSDICEMCEKLKTQKDAAIRKGDKLLAKNLTIQHDIHIRKAQVFYDKTKKYELDKPEDSLVICKMLVENITKDSYGTQFWYH